MNDEKAKMIEELRLQKERLDQMIKHLAEGADAGRAGADDLASVADSAGGGILAALDLSDDLKATYLLLLKLEDCTIEQLQAHPEVADPEAIPVHLRLLARQGHAEKYKDGDDVRFRVRTEKAGRKAVSEDIWDMLK